MKKLLTILIFLILTSPVFAASNEDIKVEFKKRVDAIENAGRNKAYEKRNREGGDLKKYILDNRDRAVPALIEIMNDEKEKSRYRGGAIDWLGALGVQEATDDIGKYLSDKGDKDALLYRSIDALSRLGNEKAIKYFINYYKAFLRGKNKGKARANVIGELAKLKKNDEAINLFIKALFDKDEVVRRYAVRALGEWKVKKAIAPIKKLLETETDFEVTMAAKKSLEKITSGEKE